MRPRSTTAAAVAAGRAAERADVLAQFDQNISAVMAIAERHKGAGVEPGIDLTVLALRLEALKGTIQAGCHEGLAK